MFRGLRRMPLLAAALVLVLAMAAACSDDGDDEDTQAVDTVIQDVVGTYNAKDADGFYAAFTDNGLRAFISESSGLPVDDLAAAKQEFESSIGEDPVKIRSTDTSINGGEATSEVMLEAGGTLEGDRFILVKNGDNWKVDGFDGYSVSPDIPDGYKTVDVGLKEFAFDVDTSDIKAGKVAFKLDNTGKQAHEALLMKVAPGVNLQDALQSEGEPEGIEFQGFTPVDSGDSFNMVLLNNLDVGHYAFVCFFPDIDDPEDTPHAFKGMVKEFDVK